ncbi:uncharacterized protein LOC130654829 [Hydractinia symbiolongicarpus]|uniref:uncharacterized protein LOC130654829 n=1 Tax=Hydractinia symbiolongicarpus TaxID=13093 RepID=UPI00254E734C|nr:uncharacterized protein LOC130654829 [Hydractinia symbiolongicarpus]
MEGNKGVTKDLLTFLRWGQNKVIWYKTSKVSGRTRVIEIWCKLCAKHKEKISNGLKGAAVKAGRLFTEKTNVVIKHNFDRHLAGELHKLAMDLEKEENGGTSGEQTGQGTKWKCAIESSIKTLARDCYKKLLRTACNFASTPSMPHKHFSVLVKYQRENGVRLVRGKDNDKTARKFIHTIADVIREKVASVISGKHFMAVQSDGSQARKTGNEKELVLVRTEKEGLPVYYMVSLLEMADFGGCDAESLKAGLDSVFENGNVPLDDYQTKLVSATADRANVNMGINHGALTMMAEEHPWLVVIHCVNHRLELANKM